jgi:hypothetical protein
VLIERVIPRTRPSSGFPPQELPTTPNGAAEDNGHD